MLKKILLSALSVAGSALLYAQEISPSRDTARVASLDEVVVTSNKYARKQSETGKVMTVISREQLDKNSGKSLAEVVNTAVGTNIIGANSNLGTNLGVSIRGSSAGNVLILLNGIPVNDPSVITNYFDLNFFAIEQVERVEILKGGQSTLYGSDAVAGVINIITRKTDTPGVRTNLDLAAGSYGTIKTNIGLNQSSEGSSLSLQYGYIQSNGFSAAHDSTGSADFDKDGFKRHNLSGNWQVTLAKNLQAQVSGLYSRYSTAIDAGAFRDEKDHNVITDNFHGGAGLSYQLPNGRLQFNYRYNQVKRQYLNDSIFGAPNYLKEDYSGTTHFLEGYGSWKWKHAELLAGLDYRKNNMSLESLSVSAWGPYTSSIPDHLAQMEQISPYASVVLKANRIFNMELGGRLNNHSVYGNNFSYTVNPSALIGERVKLFANLYSAFKTPTLYQLFNPFAGNMELTPEESINLEGGAQWFIRKGLFARAVYFHRNTREAIEFIYTDPDNFISQYVNVSRKIARGVELDLEYRGDKWNLSANYTYTAAKLYSEFDNTGFPLGKETTSNNLFRSPASVANLSGGLQLSKAFYLGAAARIAGKRWEPIYAADPVEMKGYYTIDLYGEYRVAKTLKLYVDLRNLTDQQYFELLGYNTRGFNVMGGISWSF